jgi:hypothetical protein
MEKLGHRASCTANSGILEFTGFDLGPIGFELDQLQNFRGSGLSFVFCYSERITFQLWTSCSPPLALLTTGPPRVKCVSSIASLHPAAIALSRSVLKSGRGI